MVVLVFQYSYNNFFKIFFFTFLTWAVALKFTAALCLLNIENGDNSNIEKQEQNQSAATWLVWYVNSACLMIENKNYSLRKPCAACLIQAVKNWWSCMPIFMDKRDSDVIRSSWLEPQQRHYPLSSVRWILIVTSKNWLRRRGVW